MVSKSMHSTDCDGCLPHANIGTMDGPNYQAVPTELYLYTIMLFAPSIDLEDSTSQIINIKSVHVDGVVLVPLEYVGEPRHAQHQ